MPNQICIDRCEFRSRGRNHTRFGFLAYDDAIKTYGFLRAEPASDDLEFLRQVAEESEAGELLEHARSSQWPIVIDGTHYTYAQIEAIITDQDEPEPVVIVEPGIEQVLVIPAESLFKITTRKGFIPLEAHPELKNLVYPLASNGGQPLYRERPAMEKDPSFKQLIPYVVFLSGAEGIEEIFHYTRSKLQGEERLHGQRSVGVGGHISSIDGHQDSYYTGMCRELLEELGLNPADMPVSDQNGIKGFIYDDSTEVNSVHLGVVHLNRMPAGFERKFRCEAAMAEPGMIPLRRAYAELDKYESWSQIVIRYLLGAE